MVESVEILPPEFQGLAFRDDEILGQRKIKQVLRWSTERTFRRRAVTEGLLRGGVSTRIKPQVSVGIRDMRTRNDVGPHVVEIRIQQRSVGNERSEGSAREQSSDATETPAADKPVRHLVSFRGPPAPFAEREIPGMEQRQSVRVVPTCGTVVAADVVVIREVVTTLGVGHGFRPSVGQEKIQSVGGPLL